MTAYAFELRGLCVGYDGIPLIRDIDLRVRPGEIVTLIGPNGSGKSTLLKSISRQLKPLAGTVYIAGSDMRALTQRALARRQAVMLTERTHTELLRCWDVAAAGRYPYTGRLGLLDRADEDKVRQALHAVHALDIADQDFSQISDGQRQRVLLARAICQEPEVLLLDEPTSYLDIRHKLELLGILRDLAGRQGIAVIMSLHEIDLAQKISDRVLCVKGDTILRSGPPEEIFREDVIRALYDLHEGAYSPCLGSIELPRVEGEPRAFVLSSGGTGIPVYRKLQREGVPFAAGVLCKNDMDAPLAHLLAVDVVETEPFHPLSDTALERAMRWTESCPRVLDAGVTVGPQNERIREVLARAEALGKLERVSE